MTTDKLPLAHRRVRLLARLPAADYLTSQPAYLVQQAKQSSLLDRCKIMALQKWSPSKPAKQLLESH